MSHQPSSNNEVSDPTSPNFDDASSNASANAPQRRRPNWFRVGTLIAIAIVLVPFLLFRTTSGWRLLVVSGETVNETVSATASAPSNDNQLDSATATPRPLQITTEKRPAQIATEKRPLQIATGKRPFRIATWNIAHGRGAGDSNLKEGGEPKRARVKQIAQFIKELDADVVVLNEVDFSATWSGGFDQAEAIGREAGYPVCVKQANLDFGFLYGRWYFGNVILSRLPISDPQIVDLEPLAQWESWLVGHKRGLSCTVELPNGQKVSVVGLHLESRNETIRSAQVDDVARHCGTLTNPIIVAGDLNTSPSCFPGSQKASDGSNAFDKLINQTQFTRDSRDPEKSESMTYSTEDPKLAIDWVLVSHELTLKKVEIIESMLSDHRPVVATIEFSND